MNKLQSKSHRTPVTMRSLGVILVLGSYGMISALSPSDYKVQVISRVKRCIKKFRHTILAQTRRKDKGRREGALKC